jgi:hypothetical protein
VTQTGFLRSLPILQGWSVPRDYLSVDYVILPEQRLVSVHFERTLSARGIEMYAAALRADSRFDPTFAELVHLRQVKVMALQANDALRLADQADPFAREAKRAFVATTEEQVHSARMHQLLLSGESAYAFLALPTAQRWIFG